MGGTSEEDKEVLGLRVFHYQINGLQDFFIYSEVKSENVGHSVMSDSLQHHGMEHTRLLCP